MGQSATAGTRKTHRLHEFMNYPLAIVTLTNIEIALSRHTAISNLNNSYLAPVSQTFLPNPLRVELIAGEFLALVVHLLAECAFIVEDHGPVG